MRIEYKYHKKHQELLDVVEGELGKLLEAQLADYVVKCKESNEASPFGGMWCPDLKWCGDYQQIAYLNTKLEEMKQMFVPETLIVYQDPEIKEVPISFSIYYGESSDE